MRIYFPYLAIVVFLWATGSNVQGVIQETTKNSEDALPQSWIVPFAYDAVSCRVPLVLISVNGHKPLPFLLDTGFAGTILFQPWAAKQCDIKIDEDIHPVENRPIRFFQAQVKNVLLCNTDTKTRFDITPKTVWVIDRESEAHNQIAKGVRVAGALGCGILQNYPLKMDYRNCRLTFSEQSQNVKDVSVELMTQRNSEKQDYAVNVQIGPHTYKMLLDTGASTTNIAAVYAERLANLPRKKSTQMDYSESSPTRKFLVPNLTIGTVKISPLWVAAGVKARAYDGLLGNDVMRNYLVELDFPGERMILQTVSTQRAALGDNGIVPAKADNGWFVYFVAPDSPAARQKVRSLDKIIAIDNQNLEDCPDIFVWCLMKGATSKETDYTLERTDALTKERQTFTMRLKRARRAAPYLIFLPKPGITLVQTPGGRFFVAAIQGAQSNDVYLGTISSKMPIIRQGEEIVAVNRQLTHNLTAVQWQRLSDSKRRNVHSLTVKNAAGETRIVLVN